MAARIVVGRNQKDPGETQDHMQVAGRPSLLCKVSEQGAMESLFNTCARGDCENTDIEECWYFKIFETIHG